MRISAEAAEGRVGAGGRCGSVRRTDGEHIDWRSSIAPWASGPAPKRRRRGSISPRATPDAPRASTGSNNNTFPSDTKTDSLRAAPRWRCRVRAIPRGRTTTSSASTPPPPPPRTSNTRTVRRRVSSLRPHPRATHGHSFAAPIFGTLQDDHRRSASFRIHRRSPRIRTRTTARTRSSSGSSARGMSSPTRTIAKSTTHSWHPDASTS